MQEWSAESAVLPRIPAPSSMATGRASATGAQSGQEAWHSTESARGSQPGQAACRTRRLKLHIGHCICHEPALPTRPCFAPHPSHPSPAQPNPSSPAQTTQPSHRTSRTRTALAPHPSAPRHPTLAPHPSHPRRIFRTSPSHRIPRILPQTQPIVFRHEASLVACP